MLLLAASVPEIGRAQNSGAASTQVGLRDRGFGLGFIDVGADDGLERGQELKVFRGGAQVASCVVQELASSHAACAAPGLLDGDRIEVPTQLRPVRPPLPPIERPASTPDAVTQRLLRASLPRVEFLRERREAPSFPRAVRDGHRFEMAIGTQLRGVLGRGSNFARPEAMVAFAEDRLLPGLMLLGRARVNADVVGPNSKRFSPALGVLPQLEALSARYTPDWLPVILHLGRFRPARAPGSTVVDGALVGVRLFDERLEAGAYLGGIPDPVSLAPTFIRGTVSAYGSSFARPLSWLALSAAGRAGLLWRPDGAVRLEAEGRAHADVGGWLEAGASARGGTADPIGLGAQLDLFHAFARARAWRLEAGAGYRFQAGSVFDLDGNSPYVSMLELARPLLDAPLAGLGVEELSVDGINAKPRPGPRVWSHHVDGDARLRLAPWLDVAAVGWAAIPGDPILSRFGAGPELTLTRLLGRRDRFRLGGQVSLGALASRLVFAQAEFLVTPELWLAGRTSLSETGTIVEPARLVRLTGFSRWTLFWWLHLEGRLNLGAGLPGPRMVTHDGSPLVGVSAFAHIRL